MRSVNSLGFTAGMQKNKRVGPACFFATQADLKRYSRLKNQSASIDASGPAGFFFVSEHPKEKNPPDFFQKNKRNRGYPADFEFIESPLIYVPEAVS